MAERGQGTAFDQFHVAARRRPVRVAARVDRYAREIVPSFNAYLYFRIGYWIGRKWWGQGFASEAARAILRGWANGEFEIHFPRRFTRVLKLLRLLPNRWYFWLMHRASGL